MSARLLLRLLVLGCACPSLAACRTRLLVSDITDVAETPRAELIDGMPALMIGSTQERRWGLATFDDDVVKLQTCTGARCVENEP